MGFGAQGGMAIASPQLIDPTGWQLATGMPWATLMLDSSGWGVMDFSQAGYWSDRHL